MNELVKIQKDQVVTSSRKIAEVFEKRHDNVLKDIDNLIEGSPKKIGSLFYETNYTHPQNKQEYREILMNRDGFTLLAMGFTGKKALEWKLKYIEAFNKMEQHIKSQILESYAIEDPIERAKAWIREQEEKQKLITTTKQQEQIIGELKPKADYTDRILKNKGLVTISQIAKDYGMSGQAMNRVLHRLKVQYSQSGQWLLYAKHHSKGYTHSETIDIVRRDGTPDITMNTKWTQKGRLFLYELLKENDILPVIEKEETIHEKSKSY